LLVIYKFKTKNVRCQIQHYEQEIRALKEGKHIQSSSDIYQLDPFLDKDKLLRVGCRLDCASIYYDAKHQYLIHRQNPIAYLLIHDTHKAVGHIGKNYTLIELRKSSDQERDVKVRHLQTTQSFYYETKDVLFA